MKLATKTLFAALATTGLTAGSASAAVLLGGFDGGTSNNVDAIDDAVVQDASAVGNVDVTISGIVRQRPMGETSALWGNTALTPAAETGADVAVNNNGDWTLTFVVSNTGTLDVTLEDFLFRAKRDNAGSDTSATFTYASGDLGASANTEIDIDSPVGDFVGYAFDLSTLLSDTTLSAGESATFTLEVDSAADNFWIRIDNVGFSGEVVPVPEPGSLALLGLGGLLIGARRRRG